MSIKRHIVLCDDCHYQWPANDIKLEEKRWKVNDEKFYVLSFRCPNCSREYIVSVDNDDTLLGKKEIRDIRKQMGKEAKCNRFRVYQALLNKTKIITSEIDKQQNILKQAYLKYKANDMLEQIDY